MTLPLIACGPNSDSKISETASKDLDIKKKKIIKISVRDSFCLCSCWLEAVPGSEQLPLPGPVAAEPDQKEVRSLFMVQTVSVTI